MSKVRIALVSKSSVVSLRDLKRVAKAFQTQVSRDLAPAWNVDATVRAFAKPTDVPRDHWPVTLQNEKAGLGEALAVHLERDGHPYALVRAEDDWELSASHQILEMLVDPLGNRFASAPSVRPGDRGKRVEYLTQVCDPCESPDVAYKIDGVTVSDFYTPHFFDADAAPGIRYSFTGAITRPREVLRGGYLSWRDPTTNHWWQMLRFGSKPDFRDIGVFESASSGDDANHRRGKKKATSARAPMSVLQGLMTVEHSASLQAQQWQIEMDALVERFGPGA
jgi:hypothetical protein